MTELGKRFWTWTYMTGCMVIIVAHVFLAGCVEVGGGSSSGTASNDADPTSTSDQPQPQTPAE